MENIEKLDNFGLWVKFEDFFFVVRFLGASLGLFLWFFIDLIELLQSCGCKVFYDFLEIFYEIWNVLLIDWQSRYYTWQQVALFFNIIVLQQWTY